MELRNKGLKIAKKRIEEKYFLEYQKLQETFGDKWEIYEYQSEKLHTYILYIYWKEVPFISLKFDLLPLVQGIRFWLSLHINNQ